jgi:hypothetical protein
MFLKILKFLKKILKKIFLIGSPPEEKYFAILIIGVLFTAFDLIGIEANHTTTTMVESKEAPHQGNNSSKSCRIYFRIEDNQYSLVLDGSFDDDIRPGDEIIIRYGKSRILKSIPSIKLLEVKKYSS